MQSCYPRYEVLALKSILKTQPTLEDYSTLQTLLQLSNLLSSLPVYYRRALSINPSSPVLMCHVAVVQHAMQRTDRALDTLDAAIRLAPKGWTDDFVLSMLLIRVRLVIDTTCLNQPEMR